MTAIAQDNHLTAGACAACVWNQFNYSHLKKFQKLILQNSCGIMTSRRVP